MQCKSCTAYKAAALASALVKLHASVEVVMTRNATQFITPLTFEQLTGNRTMVDTFDRNFSHQVEHIALADRTDLVIVAPATGNTLAKLACGIADTPVTLAVKAHLRNERPVILAVSSNDALAANAESIGRLLARRHHYFVPMRQDAPHKKPRSVVADFSLLPQTVEAALRGEQLQPILL